MCHFSSVHAGILADNPHLVLLYYLSQLFLRELFKSYRLIQVVPMDMSGYYGEYPHLFHVVAGRISVFWTYLPEEYSIFLCITSYNSITAIFSTRNSSLAMFQFHVFHRTFVILLTTMYSSHNALKNVSSNLVVSVLAFHWIQLYRIDKVLSILIFPYMNSKSKSSSKYTHKKTIICWRWYIVIE